MQSAQFVVIQYRNAKYQGNSKGRLRDGIGILIDDNMNFYCSEWKQSQLNGSTVIFGKHGKYIYGNWSQDRPSGFNIFRSGDIAILANYNNGVIEGEFIIIFQKQNLLVTVQKNQEKYMIIEKRQFDSYEQINKLISRIKFQKQIPKEYFSLIKFLKSYFISSQSTLKLNFLRNTYFFGFLDGIAIIFDDDNFIHRVGNTREDGEMFGIGASYKISNNEQGNFGTNLTIKYKNTRPDAKIQKLLANQHKKSMNFENQYVKSISKSLFDQLQKIIKEQIILQITKSNNQEYSSRTYSQDELNQSLEFHPKGAQQGQRLKAIRQQLYQSIGRPGASIKILPQYPNKSPIQPINTMYSGNLQQKIDSLMFKKYNIQGQIREQRFIQNKIPLIYENLEQRRQRIIQQKKSQQRKSPLNVLSPDRTLKKIEDEYPTTAFKRDISPEKFNEQHNYYKRNPIFNQSYRNTSPIKPIIQGNQILKQKYTEYSTPIKLKNDLKEQFNSYSPITHNNYSYNKSLNYQLPKNNNISGQHSRFSNNNFIYDKYQQKQKPVYIPNKSRYYEGSS